MNYDAMHGMSGFGIVVFLIGLGILALIGWAIGRKPRG